MESTDDTVAAPVVGEPENISNNAGSSEEEAPNADLNVNNNATLKSGKKTVPPKVAKKASAAPKKVAAKVSTPVKKKAKKSAAPAAHPKYSEMIAAAIVALKARQGSSRQAIVKYIESNYKVGDSAALAVRKALKKGLEAGVFVSTKGVGAAGSFRLVKVEKKQTKKAVKKPATPKKKAAPAKKKTPVKKSPAAKKAVAKKTKSPAKKSVVKKLPVKKVTSKKSPAKAKPAAKKMPMKKKAPAAMKKAMPKKKVAPKKK